MIREESRYSRTYGIEFPFCTSCLEIDLDQCCKLEIDSYATWTPHGNHGDGFQLKNFAIELPNAAYYHVLLGSISNRHWKVLDKSTLGFRHPEEHQSLEDVYALWNHHRAKMTVKNYLTLLQDLDRASVDTWSFKGLFSRRRRQEELAKFGSIIDEIRERYNIEEQELLSIVSTNGNASTATIGNSLSIKLNQWTRHRDG